MSTILIIEKCDKCYHHEDNMYHGSCCWHPKVAKPCEDGHIPKRIRLNYYNSVEIPKWCPLEELK